MSPRLPTIARAFNERIKGYVATAEPSWTSTDRPLAGTRLVHHGKGRRGFEITIKNKMGEEVFRYDTSASSFRSNTEAAMGIERLWGAIWFPEAKVKPIVCFKCREREDDKTRGRFRSTLVVSGVLFCPKCSKA